MNKPLAKSLHTVTVLVRVAKELQNRQFPLLHPESAVGQALIILGLADQNDDYNLISQAVKQLSK
jgi:hypothetical protein